MPDELSGIAGIVLAAGASRRMGPDTNKLLLEIDGEPMVRRAARRALEAGLDPVVVVTGHDGDAVRTALTGLGCTFARSADPTGPTAFSLHAGLRALDEGVEAAVIVLADMVHVTPAMIRDVAAGLRRSRGGVTGSRYGGSVFAPPLGFTRSLWPELLAWTGDGCGKATLLAHLTEATVVEWPGEVLSDVDTLEDFEALRARGQRPARPAARPAEH